MARLLSSRSLAFTGATLGPLLLTGCSRRGSFAGGYSMWGLLILVLDIVAVLDILKQPWDTTKKIIWVAVIFFLPFAGLLAYYLFGGRQKV